MQELYPLFALAIIWTIFAVIQDLRSREVANWLNFSLIAFALSYRAFYSLSTKDPGFFYFGFLGFLVFLALTHALYYAQAFGGGDAKLLIGYGAILPFSSYQSLLTITLFFTLLLFSVGAIYSLLYSIGLAIKRKKQFQKSWTKVLEKYNSHTTLASIAFFVLIFPLYGIIKPTSLALLFLLAFLLIVFPILFLYIKALDKCMIVLTKPNKLTEGDWIEEPIRLTKNKTIAKTVHGLSLKEINLLKKYKKSVLVKEGIPFTPAFIFALLITIVIFITSELSLTSLLSFF